jgi:hypothetical protein
MLKTIGAVVLGYVVIFVIVFLLFSAAYLAMGADRAFRPQSYEVSNLWIAISLILSLLAAVVGGAVAFRVGRSDKAVVGLAVLVVVLGILMALPTLMGPPSGEPEIRTAAVGNLEAMNNAKPPTWMNFMNPILGAVGVLVGGRLRKRPA